MKLITVFSDFLWTFPGTFLLFGLALYFSIKTGFIQRHIFKGIRLSLSSSSKSGLSSFSCLTTTLAATLGVGNIIGMSLAVALGGPGAVFWCWFCGIMGMAVSYAEASIYVNCKSKQSFSKISGPMSAINELLKKPHIALVYAFCVVCFAIFCSATIQSNAFSQSTAAIFNLAPAASGFLLAIIIFYTATAGGDFLHRLCKLLVPIMGLLFISCILIILCKFHKFIGISIKQIVTAAFNPKGIIAGSLFYPLSSAIRQGVARGLFTNEAGLGTAALTACEADNSPRVSGLINMSATFWDTVVLCGITGLAIVCVQNAMPSLFKDLTNAAYINAVFCTLGRSGNILLSLAIIFFALATLIGWYFYGMLAFSWITEKKHMAVYTFFYTVMCFIGSLSNIASLFSFSDLLCFILLAINTYALIKLRHFLE